MRCSFVSKKHCAHISFHLSEKVRERFTEGLKSHVFEVLFLSFLPNSHCWLFFSPHRIEASISVLGRV